MNAMPGGMGTLPKSFSFILWYQAQQTNCNQPELLGICVIGNFFDSENPVHSYMRTAVHSTPSGSILEILS